ncbi:MAG: 1,4-alpha-glucan branching protein GlgB [Myxococcales bacterium]|nr:1,4-alpha-glucan branching protein GlgB [Myxococcales bacterium]
MNLLSETDLYLLNEGRHLRLYQKLGAQLIADGTHAGCHFAVWAPNAERISVLGDWNDWQPDRSPLRSLGPSGVWQGFIADVQEGQRYVYQVTSRYGGYQVDKADPFAFSAQVPPEKASVVTRLDYKWNDEAWLRNRRTHNALSAPQSIYELHLGSWRRNANGQLLSYRQIAPLLVEHVVKMGFTHVELLPLQEHPFYGSWGYQSTGYFAATSRYGSPQDLMFLIDSLHQAGIGVILDWVPSHFPSDAHGLGFFDGTHLFEHQDPRLGFHPEWHSLLFNYGRSEVRSFLLSSALFWLDRYHIDGLRVDGVASMLYLDYSRKEGEWIPNRFGGKENLDAVSFLRQLSEDVYREYPDVQTIAEESTSWPMVSRPTSQGGLGFGMKWDMGWMHDTLKYLALDPVHRRHHHNLLTFRGMYAHSENFVLSLSHDEVVHLKGSLLQKMGGPHADPWQKRATLRLLFGYQFALPGKKLLFMGAELGEWREWNHDGSLDWTLLDRPEHAGIARFVADLNKVYRQQPALSCRDFDPSGFRFLSADDRDQSVLSFVRIGDTPQDTVVIVCNFTPVPRDHYPIGVPCAGFWQEILNSDATAYGGSGLGNLGGLTASPCSPDALEAGMPYRLSACLPPLAVVYFRLHFDPSVC